MADMTEDASHDLGYSSLAAADMSTDGEGGMDELCEYRMQIILLGIVL